MTYIERKEREEYLLFLLKSERLTSLDKLAYNFNCSTRTIKRMLENLRLQGYDIYYNRANCRYLLRNN